MKNNENQVAGQYTLTRRQHPSKPLLLAVERMGKPSLEIVGWRLKKHVKILLRDLRNVAAVGVVTAK